MPLDRLPVAARDRAGQLEAGVHDSADERIERLGRRAGGLEQRLRRGAQRDEVVRGHRRAGVVRGALVVVEVERPEPERLGEPPADRAGLVGLGAHRAPDAVELLRPALLRERLQRVQAEAARVRVERVERRRAADVRDPRPDGDLGRDLAIARSGTQSRTSSGVGRVERDAALGEPRAHRRADAPARAHDLDALDHLVGSSSRSGYRAAEVCLARATSGQAALRDAREPPASRRP